MKKTLAATLSVLASLALLAGCGESGSSDAGAPAGSQGTPSQKVQAVTAQTLEGKTFKLKSGGAVKFDKKQLGSTPLGQAYAGSVVEVVNEHSQVKQGSSFGWIVSTKCPVTETYEANIATWDRITGFQDCVEGQQELLIIRDPETMFKDSGKLTLDQTLADLDFSSIQMNNGELTLTVQPKIGGKDDVKYGDDDASAIGYSLWDISDADTLSVNNNSTTLTETK